MNVFYPAQIEEIFAKWRLPARFSPGESAGLQDTIPVVHSTERILAFPTPAANDGLNILNLRELLGVDPAKPPSFFDHPWYLSENFGLDKCKPGWHLLHMEVIPESVEKPHDYYRCLSVTLPSAIEVVLMLFLHFELTGERLLWKKHTWCSDEASLGRFVTVGAFGRNGLFISSHPPAFASRGLGICGKLTC